LLKDWARFVRYVFQKDGRGTKSHFGVRVGQQLLERNPPGFARQQPLSDRFVIARSTVATNHILGSACSAPNTQSAIARDQFR